jgi:hypothetical protein
MVYRKWFNPFMMGRYSRMGDNRRPDQAMHVEVMLKVQDSLECDFFKAPTIDKMLKVCVHGVFFICGICTGLQGEELPLMSLDVTIKYGRCDNYHSRED